MDIILSYAVLDKEIRRRNKEGYLRGKLYKDVQKMKYKWALNLSLMEGPITYAQLLEVINLTSNERIEVGCFLGAVNDVCKKKGIPPLNYNVVCKTGPCAGLPSASFLSWEYPWFNGKPSSILRVRPIVEDIQAEILELISENNVYFG